MVCCAQLGRKQSASSVTEELCMSQWAHITVERGNDSRKSAPSAGSLEMAESSVRRRVRSNSSISASLIVSSATNFHVARWKPMVACTARW